MVPISNLPQMVPVESGAHIEEKATVAEVAKEILDPRAAPLAEAQLVALLAVHRLEVVQVVR
jgi:hypothetical protein